MLAWMAYATLAGSLLAGAGAMLEHASPWLGARRRLVWLGSIGATLLFAAAATLPTHDRRDAASARAVAQVPTASAARAVGLAATVTGRERTSASHVVIASPRSPWGQPAQTAGVDALLLVLWGVSSALCVGVLLMSAWRVDRMRRTWRERMLAGVPVFVSHDVGPAVIGLVHHGIVVPGWVEALGADEQGIMMTHEREHVRAGDPLLLWGATLLVAITPWNVALWYSLRRLRHAIEIDCDARVLRSRPDARAYCTLLLDVGERTLAGVAPVAALAEPATLLERRIEAMLQPARKGRRAVAGGAAVSLALFIAACFTPRPDVAPRARVAQLVSELGALLARDSVRQSLSATDRSRISEVLAASAHGATSADRADDTAAVRTPSTVDRSSFEGGRKVVQLARDSFPEAFQPRDDAIVVMTVFDADYHAVRHYARRFRVDEVFDVLPGPKDSITSTRGVSYLVSRVVPGWRPRLRMAGSQSETATPHAAFIWAVLMPGEALPPPQDRQGWRTGSTPPAAGSDEPITSGVADSVARSLYPATYAPHNGLPVVGLIFSARGQLLRHGLRHASHDEVFVPTYDAEPARGEFSRSGDDLLSLVFTGMPARVGRWSTLAHRTYTGPALVWTILAGDAPLPSPRGDVVTPAIVDRTASRAHREARVTLAGTGADERWIKVYATQTNQVEAGAVRGTVRDTMRVRLPSSITINLGPGGDVHFVAEDARPFSLSAQVAGWDVPFFGTGARIVLEGGGAGLKTFR